jgi:hypothetical protein
MGYARELAELATAYNTGSPLTHRNKIINGGMVIDQRNNGASISNTTSILFPVDRFAMFGSASSKFNAQKNAGSVTPPIGFSAYLGITSTAATTPSSGDIYLLRQPIEGFNIADLNWGTANAKTITVSFWARSSLTGNFGGCVTNGDVNRSFPFSYTINSANTWEYKTVTVVGPTDGTWYIDNQTGIRLYWNLGAGSSFNGTANTWGTVTDATFPAGSTQVVATNGATLYITGVQLEAGRVATPFEYRPYGTEFDLCRRYFEILRLANNNTSNQYVAVGTGMAWSANDVRVTLGYYPKRALTTCAMSGSIRFQTSGGGQTLTSFTFDAPGLNNVLMFNASTSGFTTGQALQLTAENTSSFISFSAEL